MKVGTDGVLLGAWVNCKNVRRVLDVGAGTGLISLMIAQRSKADIFAVELDKEAAGQCKDNFKNSKWAERLSVENISFQNYVAAYDGEYYDLIVCNPPYFTDSLKAKGDSRTLARHSDFLALEDIVDGALRLLSEVGMLGVILPFDEADNLKYMAASKGLHLNRLTEVVPTLGKEVKRCLLSFVRQDLPMRYDTLVIENGARHMYMEEFKILTRDFYLDKK